MAQPVNFPTKDPDEVKDYRLDWSAMLGEDTIATSAWTVVTGDGLTINSQSKDNTSSTVWLSAGVNGVTYELLNKVTTAGGRTYEQSAQLSVVDSSNFVPGANAQTFKARYPEFSGVSNMLISLVMADAVDQVGDTWIERDRLKAQLLLTAHLLTLEGEPARTNTGQGVGLSGAVKRRKVGDVEVEFAGVGGGSGGSAATGYGATTYGQQFAALMRKNFPAIAVV